MIYVLFALLAALGWAVQFILQWPWWIAAIVTGVMAIAALVTFILKKVKARRAAAALERALADQGQQQVMNARPERRAEIQALQKQITDGISALKSSKLGGKKRGASALYSLPWYAIIGPPGAGKTTALRHSGLVFPYADSSIKGVGGTRNCDWWFTNDAIILDTAGRYATESEDQQEWLSFLDMLRKYRSNKPLNGLIIAVSIPDIIDANEAQLEAMGKKLRARIDEVMSRLKMQLPVYFLVTKCDLIAGFSEFFGDLRKSERAQAWGATFALKESKADPGGLFAREFDVLVQQIHARAAKRLVQERNRQAREAIYQFPLEFAGVKRNLQDLISQVFMVNAFQGTPIFRGFYFTSGTQEGTPMGRVLQRMGHAMGIQPAQVAQQQRVESKSYFLHDVFMRVVFPDADIAARSASEVRRQRLTRAAVSTAALAAAVMFAIPSGCSFLENRDLLEDSKARADAAAEIDWDDGRPIEDKLEVLDKLLERLKELETHEEEGVPLELTFLMYSGDDVHRPLIRVYVAQMQLGFVSKSKYELEKQLKGIKGERYYDERLLLKTYLMLSDVDHLDVDWAAGKYTNIWAEIGAPTTNIDRGELKKRMRPHIEYYFSLIKPRDGEDKARALPVPANEKIVSRARKVLQEVPVNKRYYSLFVESLNFELLDPAGDRVKKNLVYPPVTLDQLFVDRPDVLKYVSSKSFRDPKKEKFFEVEGPYTARGHFEVLANITEAKEFLEREEWVVPLTQEEKDPDKIAQNIGRLAHDYEAKYIDAWKTFCLDIDVRAPANLNEAQELYAVLKKEPWPYLRVLRALEDHTQWKKDFAALQNDKATGVINSKLNQKLTQKAKGLRFNLDVKEIAGKASTVPPAFQKTVAFGVPEDGARTPLNETPLANYMDKLGILREKIAGTLDKQPTASVNLVAIDLQNAVREIDASLQNSDDMARRCLLPLLMNPLNVGGKIPIKTF